MNQILKIAGETGFTNYREIDIHTLDLLPEVREMCQVNKCGAFGKNWSCPPACGSLEECQERVKAYTDGIIVQSTATLEDPFDYEAMQEMQHIHQRSFIDFVKKLRAEHYSMLPLGCGACISCKNCTYPDLPCRFPEEMFSPMEAYGIFVSDLCQKNDIPYYYGNNTLTYVSLVLFQLDRHAVHSVSE